MRTIIILIFTCCLGCNQNLSEEKSDDGGNDAKTEIIDTVSMTDSGPLNDNDNHSFDKSKWRLKDDHHYIYRDIMLHDLLDRHQLDSLNKDEVIDLLGNPDRIDNNYLFYTISQKRVGIWPIHTKTLVIKFYDDHKLEWVRIHE
jgi:hypothetical protein